MKNFKHLTYILLLIQCLSGFPQQKKKFEIDSLPYPERYQKIKVLYIKRIDSDVYKNSKKASWAYYDMLNLEASDTEAHSKMSSLEWSKANLYKTDFGSFEEAEREWKKLEDALFLETEENKDYWDYYLKCLVATKVYDLEQQLEADVRKGYPEKFLTRPKRKKKESFLPKLPSLPKN